MAVDEGSASDLVTAYFAAASQAAIDAAEAAIHARSSGSVTQWVSVARGRGATDAWLGGLRAIPGGLRSSVIFGDTDEDRGHRIGHVDLAAPIAHPSGVGRTRCVPVPPLAARRPVAADGVLGEPPADALYAKLVRANAGMAHANRDPDAYAEGRAHLAGWMAKLLASIGRGVATRRWSLWEQRAELPPVSIASPPQRAPREPAAIWAFRVFADGTGLVAFARAIVVFRQRDGKVLRVHDTGGAELLAAPSPALALLQAWVPTGRKHVDVPDRDEEAIRIFAMDLRTGKWAPRPAEPAPIWFEEAMETSRLRDHDGRVVELLLGDYPIVSETTPDHRFVWVEDKHGGGGIYRMRDAALVTRLDRDDGDPDVPHLDARGQMKATRRSADAEGHGSTALCRTPRGRWLTFRDGVVAEDGRPFLTIGGRSKLATFSTDGDALWLADGREVRCIELGPASARVTTRWPYPPLRVAAGAPARPRPIVI